MMTYLIIYFLLAIIISFLCSLLEACLLSIPITHVVVLEKEGKKSGKILKELKKSEGVITVSIDQKLPKKLRSIIPSLKSD